MEKRLRFTEGKELTMSISPQSILELKARAVAHGDISAKEWLAYLDRLSEGLTARRSQLQVEVSYESLREADLGSVVELAGLERCQQGLAVLRACAENPTTELLASGVCMLNSGFKALYPLAS